MNKIMLIGNLTRDPELSETKGGVSYCNFSIAVSRSFTNADGERETDFSHKSKAPSILGIKRPSSLR